MNQEHYDQNNGNTQKIQERQEIQEIQERQDCIICLNSFENDTIPIYTNCLHGPYCSTCLTKISLENEPKCSLCRGIIPKVPRYLIIEKISGHSDSNFEPSNEIEFEQRLSNQLEINTESNEQVNEQVNEHINEQVNEQSNEQSTIYINGFTTPPYPITQMITLNQKKLYHDAITRKRKISESEQNNVINNENNEDNDFFGSDLNQNGSNFMPPSSDYFTAGYESD